MKREPVISSNIVSVGWEEETLEVAFKNGAIYQYQNVPESVFQAFLSSESKGKYLAANIKGSYNYDRIS